MLHNERMNNLNNRTVRFILLCLMLIALIFPNTKVSAETSFITYSGSIDGKKLHVYKFATSSEGMVNIEDLGTSSSLITYQLVSEDSKTEYVSGDVLPAGTYLFKVNSDDTNTGKYSFKLSGIQFLGTPDNSLPTLNVTNPTGSLVRLSKGTSTINLTGSTNGTQASVSVNKVNYSLAGNFTKTVNLKYGLSTINFKAVNSNGNMVFESHQVIAPGYKRLDGTNRYAVSANISKEIDEFRGLEEVDKTIILSNDSAFADALSGVTIAAKEKAPILLTSATNGIPSEVKTEIERLKSNKAIILGGEGSVPVSTEDELRALGVTSIERITGTNRYEVATNIAKKIITQDTDTAFIASGESFPDALSVASIAGQLQIPLLTTNSSNLSAEVKTFLANNPQINHFVISGGSVSSTVENQLKTYGTVSRISGSNRFEVAENAANAFNIIPNTITVANGMDFPDALTGGVLSALSKGPLLLATPTSTSIETLRYFEKYSLDINNFYILGGTGSVSNDTINKLYPYIQ